MNDTYLYYKEKGVCQNENALLKTFQFETLEHEKSISKPYLRLRNGLFFVV